MNKANDRRVIGALKEAITGAAILWVVSSAVAIIALGAFGGYGLPLTAVLYPLASLTVSLAALYLLTKNDKTKA